MTTIDSFEGPNHFLSNFFPVVVERLGVVFPSVEHAYQAAKSHDPRTHATVAAASTAGAAKKIGRMLELRSDWDNVKLGVMRDLLHQKFTHPELRRLLLATGDALLIEGNWWGDTYWGVCKGEGLNHLGLLLMEVREMLVKNP